MLVLGIILLLLGLGAFVAALAGGSNQPASFDLGLVQIQTNTLGVFLLGAATVVLLVFGIALIGVGIRRANRRRQERKKLDRLTEELRARENDEKQAVSSRPEAGATAETETRPTGTGTGDRPDTAGAASAPTESAPGATAERGDGPVIEQDRRTP